MNWNKENTKKLNHNLNHTDYINERINDRKRKTENETDREGKMKDLLNKFNTLKTYTHAHTLKQESFNILEDTLRSIKTDFMFFPSAFMLNLTL